VGFEVGVEVGAEVGLEVGLEVAATPSAILNGPILYAVPMFWQTSPKTPTVPVPAAGAVQLRVWLVRPLLLLCPMVYPGQPPAVTWMVLELGFHVPYLGSVLALIAELGFLA